MLDLTVERQGAGTTLRMAGELCRTEVEEHTDRAFRAVDKASKRVTVEMAGVARIDTTGAGLISALKRRSERRGLTFAVHGCNSDVAAVLERFLWLVASPKPRKTLADWFVQKGESLIAIRDRVVGFLQLVADTVVWSIGGEARTQRVRSGAVWEEAVRIGLDALGIITLLTFLIGAVVALMAASLLRMFAADILVADMIGIAMLRELAPLLTAVLIAGRSGAAIAAEIATMSINEEVAGIRTMGLEPVKYIVVPKFRAITLTMPGLTVCAIVAGIFGGFVIGVSYMGLSPAAYFFELGKSVFAKDLLVTLLKSVVFAWIVVWVAAAEGFSAYGGSEAVGRVTTNSVVKSIFSCIVADAVFCMVFYM